MGRGVWPTGHQSRKTKRPAEGRSIDTHRPSHLHLIHTAMQRIGAWWRSRTPRVRMTLKLATYIAIGGSVSQLVVVPAMQEQQRRNPKLIRTPFDEPQAEQSWIGKMLSRQESSASKYSHASSLPLGVRLRAAQIELTALLGEGSVTADRDDVDLHSSDAYSYHKHDSAPAAGADGLHSLVVYPESTEQVAAAVRICAHHRLTMIPYGSGTSLEGHTSAPQGGVFIDLTRMQAIRALHVDDMDVVVEPGLSWNNLNAELKKHGLFYPVDPGPGASLGGMVATNCSGTNAVRYGTMKANVLNLTVVLPDGSIVKTGNRARKSSAGYDLTRLFIGSEGTLGIVTELTLRLSNIPEATAVGTCAFNSVGSASESVIELLQKGVRVGCVELLDDGCIRAVNAYSGLKYPPKAATLFFKFHGSTAGVADDIKQTAAVMKKHGAGPFTFATDPAERDQLWEARKGALFGCIAYRPGCEAWTTDVCVPISRLADCIEQTKADLEDYTHTVGADGKAGSALFPSAVVGHVGDGNFHVIMMLDPKNPAELAAAQQVNERMVRRAIAMEGTCTGEHGVGVGKKKYLEAELGAPAIALMRTMKKALDPHNLMNPGKVFDMDSKLTAKNLGLLTTASAHTGSSAHKHTAAC